jgi:hypothetical protein
MKKKWSKVSPWLVGAIVLAVLLIAAAVVILSLPGDYRLENLIEKARPSEIRGLLATATWAK